MAQDDMHVVMYRILAYLYACMKDGADADLREFDFTAMGVNERYWGEIMSEMARRGLVKGVEVIHGASVDRVNANGARITMEGVEFLMENSMMAKARDFLISVKATVPFI